MTGEYKQARCNRHKAAQPGMQATRSARPISGGDPNSFPFLSVSGIPTARP
jgi:hypothetical protein